MKTTAVPQCLLILLLFLAGCARPSVHEEFRKAADRENGKYCFSLDMTDTAGRYDLHLFSRIDCSPSVFDVMPDTIRMSMMFTAPSGQRYSEAFPVPKEYVSRGTDFSREYEIPYRLGLVPAEKGIWRLDITIENENMFPGLRGLGLRTAWKE